MTSSATSIYSIAAALSRAASYGRFPNQWVPSGATQKSFLDALPAYADVGQIQDIESIATADYRELIQWFAQRGWNMNITPYSGPRFGVGAILDILSMWKKPGDQTTMLSDGQQYEAVSMGAIHSFSFMRAASQFRTRLSPQGNASENLIVALSTQRPNEYICMMMVDPKYQPRTLFQLVDIIHQARIGMERTPVPIPNGHSLTFPMVNLACDTDIGWMSGMRSASPSSLFNSPVEIEKAIQKNRLRINHLGAHAESATALMLCGSASRAMPLSVVVDRPFLFWIERQEIQQPLFCAYVDRMDWKNPGDIKSVPKV